MNFKNYVMLSSALAGMAFGVSAYAQTAPAAPATASSDKDEVVVVGIRKSLKKSLDVKRANAGQIDVITAEGVGKFPDTNVAEALSHLPGIAVDRAYGEGEHISILGVDSNLNKILIDGHTIASGDWGGNPNDPNARSFNYSLLAPELIGQAEVYKSWEARLDEGAIGGTVIIHTRRPLDLPSQSFDASIGVSQNQKPGDQQKNPRASLLGSWKNDTGTFGVLAAASYNKDTIGGSSVGTFGWDREGSTFANGIKSTDWVPSAIDQGAWIQDRIRTTLSTDIQWKPSANWEFNLSSLFVNGIYNNYSETAFSYIDYSGASNFTNVQHCGGAICGASIPSLGRDAELDDYYRKTAVNTATHDLSMKWTDGPWKVTADIGHTEAVSSTDPSYYLDLYGQTTINYSINRDGVYEKFGDPFTDPTFFSRASDAAGDKQAGFIESYFSHDKEDFGQADGTLAVDWGAITTLQFGAKYSHHINTYIDQYYNVYTSPDPTKTPVDVADFDYTITPASWAGGLGASGDVLQNANVTKSSLINWMEAHQHPTYYAPQSRDTWVTEDLGSLYSEAVFHQDQWRGNFGLRYIYTRDRFSWDDSVSVTDAEGNTTQEPDTLGRADKAYEKLLPAVNIAYDLQRDMVLRFNSAQVISRPQFGFLSGGSSFSVGPGGITGGGGNPNLKPYEATNYGVSYEWYFAKDSLFSVDFFIRDVSSYVVQETQYESFPQFNEPIRYSSPFNGTKSFISGFSTTYQTTLPYGFGFISNFTYSNADTPSSSDLNGSGYKLTMPYLSRYLVNFIPYYESGPWTARASLAFRSKYSTDIVAAGGQNAGGSGSNGFNDGITDWTDQWFQLDASVSYKINDHIKLTLSGQNLLDPVAYTFQGTRDMPEGWNKNGAKYALGVSYKY